MLRISFQTLRARRATLAGAFVAIWLAVTLAYATGLLMDAALSPPGPGRFGPPTPSCAPIHRSGSPPTAMTRERPSLDARLVDHVAAVEALRPRDR